MGIQLWRQWSLQYPKTSPSLPQHRAHWLFSESNNGEGFPLLPSNIHPSDKPQLPFLGRDSWPQK